MTALAKTYRLTRGWTQKQMARKCKVHRLTIIRIEKGLPVTDLTRAKVDKVLHGGVK